jgi:hypothetical protein
LEAGVAAVTGLFAGGVGWGVVCLGWCLCSDGVRTVGPFVLWAIAFVSTLDMLMLSLLTPPSPPLTIDLDGTTEARHQASRVDGSVPCAEMRAEDSRRRGESNLTANPTAGKEVDAVASLPQSSATLGHSWDTLTHGVRRLAVDELRVLGLPPPTLVGRKWLTVGIVVDSIGVGKADTFLDMVGRTILAGTGDITVCVLLSGRPSSARTIANLQSQLSERFKQEAADGSLRILRPQPKFYPGPPVSDSNVDHALLLSASEPFSEFYMQLEPDCAVTAGFTQSVKEYISSVRRSKRTYPLQILSLGKEKFTRKVVRADLLPRLAEMLLLVPDTHVDNLFWNFYDVVGNESAPKSCTLNVLALRGKRPDVVLQYWKADALIEHVGDVSSLEGKVQRLHDDFFRKNLLADNLFDRPPPAATLRTTLGGREDLLQALYDGRRPTSPVSCGAHQAAQCADCTQGRGAGWCNVDCIWDSSQGCIPVFRSSAVSSIFVAGAIELTFSKPIDIEIVRLRFGGMLKPFAKNQKGDPQRKDSSFDTDFDDVLDNAELRFGSADDAVNAALGDRPLSSGSDPCRNTRFIDKAVGREVFWRTSKSNPARNVSCILISVLGKQLRPLAVRGINIRTSRGRVETTPTPIAEGKNVGSGNEPLGAPSSIGANGLRADQGVPPGNLEVWWEEHLAWGLIVSTASASGALAGMLGCTVRALFCRSQHGHSIRPT